MKKLAIAILCVMLLFCSCAATSNDMSNDTAAQAPTESAAVEYAPEQSGETGAQDVENSIGQINIPETDRKLVYTSSFSIESKQFDEDYQTIMDQLGIYEGYVESESTYGQPPKDYDDMGRTSSMTLRVPVDRLNQFLASISGVGTVVEKNTQTEDVSLEYYDTESRIKLLEDRITRLETHLEQATSADDIIQLESEISEALYELDQLESSMRKINSLIDYATVNIELYEVARGDIVVNKDETLGERSKNAFESSWEGLKTFGEGFLVVLSALAPILIVLAVIAAIVLGIIWGVRRRKRKKREKKQGQMPKSE